MKWADKLKLSDVKNELCKTCGKERRRLGSAYGEKCARINKGLPVPEDIKPLIKPRLRKELDEKNSSSQIK